MRFSTLAVLASLVVTASLPATAQSIRVDNSDKNVDTRVYSLYTPAQGPTAPFAQFLTAGAVFFEGFESSTPDEAPAGWVVENLNGDANAWFTFDAATNPAIVRTGERSALVLFDAASAADDWMVSPGFSLTAGTAYRVSFWFKPGNAGFGTAEDIELAIGDAQTVAAMTTILADLDGVPAGDFQQVVADYTPSASGTYHLGFHCNSPADQFFCAVDDITVNPAPTGPVISVNQSAVAFGPVPNGSGATVAVAITNDGTSDLTVNSVSRNGDDEFSFDLSGLSGTITPGATETFDISFMPTEDGDYSGSFSISSNDPGSPTIITVTGSGVTPPDNDTIAGAIPITGPGTYTGTNVNATSAGEPVPSCQENQDASVFWSYTPTADATIAIDLAASEFDTILTFHEADGTEIDCNDDIDFFAGQPQSRLSGIEVTGGTTYLIRVAGFSFDGVTDQGAISFDLYEYTATASGFGRAIDGSTSFSRPSSNGDGTSGSCTTSTSTMVYDAVDVTVSESGPYQITANFDGYDGYLLVYEGGFDDADVCTNLIARDDDFDNGNGAAAGAQVPFVALDAGTTYTFVVTTFDASTAAGAYSFEVVGAGAVTFPVANEADLEGRVSLGTPSPNPTVGAFRLGVTLTSPESVRVTVLDVLGREVAVVHDGPLVAGETMLSGTTRGLPAGQYLVRAVGETFAQSRAMTVVR